MELLSERRLERIERAVASGRIVPFLAFATFVITIAAALVVRLFAPGEFETFGESVWWAAQTITTVGYGDVIPETAFSKAVAVVVMFFGVSVVALVTAVATSAVITRSQRRLAAEADSQQDAHTAALERIERRLDELERRITDAG
jgi:voltage-gated potassium channel